MPKQKMWIAGAACLAAVAAVPTVLVGCGGSSGTAQAAPSGIDPKKVADMVHEVMVADRTVYAKHIVTRLKKEASPITPDEYWNETTDGTTIPLPAQVFRMGAEIVNGKDVGFSYSLISEWPLNPKHTPESDIEKEGVKAIQNGEPFYGTETIDGQEYLVAIYGDKAVAEACWVCHNEHPNKGEDYPEFAEGDVMGGIIVRIPM